MMNSKHVLLSILLITGLVTACHQNSTKPVSASALVTEVSLNPINDMQASPKEMTSVTVDERDYKFGNITIGRKAVHRFTFKNTGNMPLVIENVKSACGCTTTDYTKEPIAPGESGFVETSMDGKTIGIFKKSATVTMNTEPRTVILNFSGEVIQ